MKVNSMMDVFSADYLRIHGLFLTFPCKVHSPHSLNSLRNLVLILLLEAANLICVPFVCRSQMDGFDGGAGTAEGQTYGCSEKEEDFHTQVRLKSRPLPYQSQSFSATSHMFALGKALGPSAALQG